MKNISFFQVTLFTICLVILGLSSCREECTGKKPIVRFTNYCYFDMAIEVDIIGGAVHLDTLEYMETKTFTTHETRVNIKAKEADPLITLSRSKKIDTKNCWLYDFEMVENDSNILYDFDLNKDRTYSP